MENDLDAWAQELREAGCCLSGFILKVKALEILRKLGQFDGKFLATDGWLSKVSRSLFTFDGANNIQSDDSDDSDSSIYFLIF
jgi:hypothetical protein